MNSKKQYWKTRRQTYTVSKMTSTHVIKTVIMLEEHAKEKHGDEWRKHVWPVYYLLVGECKRRKLNFNHG